MSVEGEWGSIMDLIEKSIGGEAAHKLCSIFGGRRLYVPKQPGASSRIATAIGLKAAQELSGAFGGEHIDVPTGTARGEGGRRLRIIEALAAGMSVSEAATACDVSRMTVIRARKYMKANAPQIRDQRD